MKAIQWASPRSGRRRFVDGPSSAARLRGLAINRVIYLGLRGLARGFAVIHPGYILTPAFAG